MAMSVMVLSPLSNILNLCTYNFRFAIYMIWLEVNAISTTWWGWNIFNKNEECSPWHYPNTSSFIRVIELKGFLLRRREKNHVILNNNHFTYWHFIQDRRIFSTMSCPFWQYSLSCIQYTIGNNLYSLSLVGFALLFPYSLCSLFVSLFRSLTSNAHFSTFDISTKWTTGE